MKRPGSLFISKKSLILICAVLVLAAGAGYSLWNDNSQPNTKSGKLNATKYISLAGGYLFSTPAKYVVDETTVRGVAVVYSQDTTTLLTKNLDELYGSGVVTVQPIKQLKNGDAKAFKDYVNNTVAADLRKAMGSGSNVGFSKKGDTEAARVSAILNSGTILRVAYVLNLPQPVMVVAKDESDAFKIVGSSLEDLNKTNLKPDIDQAAQAARTVVELLSRQDASGIKGRGTTDFNKNVTKDQLVANLSSSATYLDRKITVVGGTYDGKVFIAQLVFEPKTKDGTPVGRVLSLSKQGKNWKLDGFQLPQ